MKILVVCSSLDLRAPFSATPAWWQLLKALAEEGHDLIVSTYHGSAPETPWWRGSENPVRVEGALFQAARAVARRVAGERRVAAGGAGTGESWSQRLVRRTAHAVSAPRWRRHLLRLLRAEPDARVVLFMGVPPNHLCGVAGAIRSATGVAVAFYDGDVPASLPGFQGFASGFRIYDGADLREFDLVLCNSEGGAGALRQLGARAVQILHYAADPQMYSPVVLEQDLDVFFYGHTAEYRAEWIEAMIAAPSRELPDRRFAVRGHRLGPVGRAEALPYASFSRLREYVARSRLNLVVTRRAHASVHASSTMRPFELAMLGACMVSNPYAGIERWFEPDREVVVVGSREEAVERYRFLLDHESERRRLGEAARRRALSEHTYRHRAVQLTRMLQEYL
jgi:hypothetical protein